MTFKFTLAENAPAHKTLTQTVKRPYPLSGKLLNEALRARLDIPPDTTPSHIYIADGHEYEVIDGKLVPCQRPLFKVKDEEAFNYIPEHAPRNGKPLAGYKLDDELREHLGLKPWETPKQILFPHTDQDYLVIDGYLLPRYDPALSPFVRNGAERTEERIVGRADAWQLNAQPELGVLRTREQIERKIIQFARLPEDTYEQCAYKAGRFRAIHGAIMKRFEHLGRVLNQRNTSGTVVEESIKELFADNGNILEIPAVKRQQLAQKAELEYQAILAMEPSDDPKEQRKRVIMLGRKTLQDYEERSGRKMPARFADEDLYELGNYVGNELAGGARADHFMGQRIIDELTQLRALTKVRAEYKEYYSFLMSSDLKPLLQLVLFNDYKIDRNGVLIDFVREIGKPIAAPESMVRQGITAKITQTFKTIDSLHATLRKALTNEPTAELFAESIDEFLVERGQKKPQTKQSTSKEGKEGDYKLRSVDDVIARLDEYAVLCRARACIKGEDDEAYDDILARKSVINGLFTGQNGLLASMSRYEGEHSIKAILDLRDLIARGMLSMNRSAYTRTPFNETAPDIWIPNLDPEAPPMERFLTEQFLPDEELTRTERIIHNSVDIATQNAQQRTRLQSRIQRQEAKGECDTPKTDKLREKLAGLPRNAHESYLRHKLCTTGRLEAELTRLKDRIRKQAERDAEREAERAARSEHRFGARPSISFQELVLSNPPFQRHRGA